MRDVTHLSSGNILPVSIFKWYQTHNIIKEHKEVIYKKTHSRYGWGDDDMMMKKQFICAGRYW